MENNFDPMTGEPIEKFDPMTGEPIARFDPVTGQPIGSGQMNFDPLTGQPMGTQQTNFDPLTGQPMGGSQINFDPITGQPLQPVKPKKRKTGIIIGCIVAGVIICAGAVFAVVKSGVFLSPQNKVLLATARTFEDQTHLVEDLGDAAELFQDDFTGNVAVSVQGVDLGFNLAYSDSKIQLSSDVSGAVSAEASAILQNSIAEIDEDEVKLYLPSLSSQVLTYNFKNEKNGYLADNYPEQLNTIDEALTSLMENKEQDEIKADLILALMKEWKTLDFEKAEKDTFTVNGKEVKCGGYEVAVTRETIDGFVDAVEAVFTKYYGNEYQITDAFESFKEEYDTMSDAKFAFYIYKGKLACIRIVNVDYDEKVDICFEGGKVRWSTIKVKYEGDEAAGFEVLTSGSTETYRLTSDGDEVFNMDYDYKNGDYTIADEYQTYEVSGNLDVSRKSASLTVDTVVTDGTYYNNLGSVSVERGASFETLDGDTFDIGEASEMDLYSLLYGSMFD